MCSPHNIARRTGIPDPDPEEEDNDRDTFRARAVPREQPDGEVPLNVPAFGPIGEPGTFSSAGNSMSDFDFFLFFDMFLKYTSFGVLSFYLFHR